MVDDSGFELEERGESSSGGDQCDHLSSFYLLEDICKQNRYKASWLIHGITQGITKIITNHIEDIDLSRIS